MKKNIIMILTDQMHKYAMGFLNEDLKTPNIDKFAEDGVSFLNAYSNNPLCTPFRANLFTGMYSCDNGTLYNNDPLSPKIECMADTFNNNGYETSFVGKWHLGDSGNKPIPKELRGGFKHFMGYQCYNGFWTDNCFYDEENNEHKFDGHRTDITTDLGIKKLQELVQKDKPFLHIIFYQSPHYPEQPSKEFAKLYENEEISYPINYEEVDPYTPTYSPYSPRPFEYCSNYIKYSNNMQEYKKLYNGMVSQIDFGVGRILDEIENLGIKDQTMVLFSSDHGDMQGAHGFKNKCLPYEESCGIPLIIRTPDSKKGVKISTPVSAIDYYPTALSYAGITTERNFDGQSLMSLVTETKITKTNYVIAENHDNNWVMIRDNTYKLVVNTKTATPYLMFDMERDSFEMNNIVEDKQYADIRNKLVKELLKWNKSRINPPIQV